MIDNKDINTSKLLQFFRSRCEVGANSTRKSYLKAVSALDIFLKKIEASSFLFTYSLLAEWLLHMYMRGLTFKTSIHYFDAIASLYKSAVTEGIAPSSEAFKSIRSAISQLDCSNWENPISDEEFKRFVNVTQTAYHQKGNVALASDLMLFSLLNHCLPLREVAVLKRSEIDGLDSESMAIVDRMSDPRRKYVFPLKQSENTAAQLNRHIAELILNLFRLRNIPVRGSIDETIKCYWTYAGLRCGFSGEELVSCLGNAPVYIPFISLVGPIALTEERRKEIATTISQVFVVNPLKWFAMRLRPNVKYQDIVTRFELLKNEISAPEMFYPRNEIVKRIGKKLKYELKPVISDVVFFRTRVTEIFPMFCRIGDLAWCYTFGGKNSRTYASIPDDSFRNFQQAIGQFTPDFEVAPAGELPMKEGDRIVVVGGMISGHTGEVAKIETDNSDNVIYRVKFGTENGFKWDFGIDARVISSSK